MLPARSRLHRAGEIREIGRRGRRRTRTGVSVSMLVGDASNSTRATVIVNKSVGGAVVRNRLRRQVRHGLARVWDQLPAGSSVVVRAQPSARSLSATELDEALRAATGVVAPVRTAR